MGAHTKHGHCRRNMKRTKTYQAWSAMIKRCCNPASGNYARYGGRGIEVCQRWMDSFEAFLEDMGEAPRGLSLDRVDSNGNYEPGNCRWVSMRVQQNNRCNNNRFTYLGREDTLANHCRSLDRDYFVVQRRIAKGLTPSQAVAEPTPRPFWGTAWGDGYKGE